MSDKGYIPMADCKKGQLYRINSRNLGLGVYDGNGGFIGIRLKLGSTYLFTEYHHDQGAPYGTVKPIDDLGPIPEEIPATQRICHDKGENWGLRDKQYVPVVRNREQDGPIGPPHRGRHGFEDRWADTNERMPDHEYPFFLMNEKLFEFLAEKMTQNTPERFSTMSQVQEWYDDTTLAERETRLKHELSNAALEKWFDDLSGAEQQTAFIALLGQPIPTTQ